MQQNTLKKVLNPLKALILPAVCYLIFFVLSKGLFGTPATLLNNAVKSVQPILLSFGINFILTEGNWDMSAGAQVLLAAIVAGNLNSLYSIGIPGIIVVCICVSLLLSLVKAVLNYLFNIPFNLLSIGLMLIIECFTYFLFDGKGTFVIGDVVAIARAPNCFIVLGVAFIAMMLVWKYARFAGHVRAIGSNRQIAQSVGINIKKTDFIAIMVGSVFSGLSAVLYLTSMGNINAVLNMTSMTLCFDAMMPIFIGMSLQRYVSLPVAIVIGAFTMKMLGTGVLAVGIPSYMQTVITGIFLLLFLSVTLNQNRMFEYRESKKRAAQIKTRITKGR